MKKQELDLSELSVEDILTRKISDLPIGIKGTWLEECVEELYRELEGKGIAFKPECYLADEWLTPDKEPVVGIPFFLAHPVLVKLEQKMMFEVEGGTKEWCMKLLRHETGHAINYAYRLFKRKKWRRVFGSFSKEYGDTYRFRPYSKSFVRHLENHYAQYHPDEDFAETFAVWLNPGRDWRLDYKGWKAMAKLLYVEDLVNGIKGVKPILGKGEKHWNAARLRITLKTYYKKKQNLWEEDFPDFHDAYLTKIFTENPGPDAPYPAVKFIRKHRKAVRDSVAAYTSERKAIIDGLMKVLIGRCSERRLYVGGDEVNVTSWFTAYVTSLIMNYVYTGRFKKK